MSYSFTRRNNPYSNWVHREISWLLESGTLSPENEKFLRCISKKKGLADLTWEEIFKLAEIQNSAGGEV